MVPSARNRRAASSPRGILGSLTLLVLIEGAVGRHADTLAPPDARDWALAERAARTSVRDCDVLCFGGSMTSHGVVPPVVTRVSGRSTFNLAVGFGPPGAQYALLRRAIASGARPSAVLFDLHPAALSEEPRHAKRLWPEVLGPSEIAELSWVARDAELFATLALAEVLPTLRYRDSIRSALTAALGGSPNATPDLNRMIARNKRVNSGGMIQPVKNFRGGVSPIFRPGLLTPPWKPSEASGIYFKRFLDLAESRSIPVFWLIPPFCPSIRRERSALGLDADYARFAASLQEKYANLTVVDGLASHYDDELFSDPVHLNRRGAAAFSEAVAGVLSERLGAGRGTGPRWVNLGAYRPAADGTLEDLSQSFLASRPSGVRR